MASVHTTPFLSSQSFSILLCHMIFYTTPTTPIFPLPFSCLSLTCSPESLISLPDVPTPSAGCPLESSFHFWASHYGQQHWLLVLYLLELGTVLLRAEALLICHLSDSGSKRGPRGPVAWVWTQTPPHMNYAQEIYLTSLRISSHFQNEVAVKMRLGNSHSD